jgi:hypothetical protein
MARARSRTRPHHTIMRSTARSTRIPPAQRFRVALFIGTVLIGTGVVGHRSGIILQIQMIIQIVLGVMALIGGLLLFAGGGNLGDGVRRTLAAAGCGSRVPEESSAASMPPLTPGADGVTVYPHVSANVPAGNEENPLPPTHLPYGYPAPPFPLQYQNPQSPQHPQLQHQQLQHPQYQQQYPQYPQYQQYQQFQPYFGGQPMQPQMHSPPNVQHQPQQMQQMQQQTAYYASPMPLQPQVYDAPPAAAVVNVSCDEPAAMALSDGGDDEPKPLNLNTNTKRDAPAHARHAPPLQRMDFASADGSDVAAFFDQLVQSLVDGADQSGEQAADPAEGGDTPQPQPRPQRVAALLQHYTGVLEAIDSLVTTWPTKMPVDAHARLVAAAGHARSKNALLASVWAESIAPAFGKILKKLQGVDNGNGTSSASTASLEQR